MSVVGAYIEIPPGDNLYWEGTESFAKGDFRGRTSEGLDVEWLEWGEPPANAQVYLYWEPKVVALWEEENENGDGDEAESAGPDPVEEVDEESGQPGDLVGEDAEARSEESEAVE